MRSRFCVLLARACVVLGMSALPAAAGTVAATAASASAQQVTYLGYTFTVPTSWQVVNLAVTAVADPTLGQSVDAFGVGSTGTAFGAGWKPATGWSAWENLGGTFTG